MGVIFGLVTFLLCFCSFSSSLPTASSSNELSRVVNGQTIDISQVPYHAAIRRKTSAGWLYTCGATVITTKALLTAAHCVITTQSDPLQFRVAVGTASRSSGGTVYDVKSVFIHEKYSTLTLENDIAMIVTSKKMVFDKNVDSAFIPEPNFDLPVGTAALVTGYGMTSYEGSASSVLRAATVEVVAQDICTRAYRQIAKISEGMLCAFANNPPRDACQGDSGGPLVTQGTLIGIVSWGEECANLSYPGVYTRVSQYYSWIIDKLAVI
ncbi:trypsin alpha-3-like [Bicyclus anynana]|uniref:Trypsin alpha-3-like n=1 Tax=Bicyclus anynana TaxID=110368 RepID=A0A6J1NVQ5_BICAN|nr:trypsin alpha-3-like [Bicyclus anynana]